MARHSTTKDAAHPTVLAGTQGGHHRRHQGAASTNARRHTKSIKPPDELAAYRAQRLQERLDVESRADGRLHEMQVNEFIQVPRLMVAVTASLAAASVLELARLWSQRSMVQRGSPWVDIPLETWLNYTGLCEQEWIEARRTLRHLRLIRERRRYDLERSELVCDIAFEPEVFESHVADLRADLKATFAEELRSKRLASKAARPIAGEGGEA
jgi:hypothetical protein